MKTKGDKILDKALSKIGSKSLFTKELEMALEDGSVDIVVHSLKDLPTTLPEGMVIGAVCEREDPRDVAVMHPSYKSETLASLPSGSVIGTSSLRREAQLKRKYPHLKFESVRGNLNTRLAKLDKGDKYTALILAAAGVIRMGWEERITQALEKDSCMYAVGQGALAVECRENDQDILDLLSHIVHKPTTMATVAERAFMFTLEGGCSAPVGVSTKVEDGVVTVEGGVWSLDGSEEIKGILSSKDNESLDSDNSSEGTPAKQPRVSPAFCGIVPAPGELSKIKQSYELGITLAKSLLEKGAKRILEEAKAANAIKPPIAPQASVTVKAS
ncbi:porphobilinogen deaminase-like protein l(3)02640 isoform X2 [Oratosquilla oratoria]